MSECGYTRARPNARIFDRYPCQSRRLRPVVDPTLVIECTSQGPGPSEPVDHGKPQRLVIVHGDKHGAGLLERDPAGHQPARVDAPGGDKLHLEILDRPV